MNALVSARYGSDEEAEDDEQDAPGSVATSPAGAAAAAASSSSSSQSSSSSSSGLASTPSETHKRDKEKRKEKKKKKHKHKETDAESSKPKLKLPPVAALLASSKPPEFLAEALKAQAKAAADENEDDDDEERALKRARATRWTPKEIDVEAERKKIEEEKRKAMKHVPQSAEEKAQAEHELMVHRLKNDPKAFSRAVTAVGGEPRTGVHWKPSEVGHVTATGLTVKEREQIKRSKGQSSQTRWKSETEMQLRQEFD